MRAVVGVLQDPASLQFKYLYDLSKPPNGRFIFVAIAPGPNGYLYLWGSEGGQTGYRHSPLFLARKRAATIGQPGGMHTSAASTAIGARSSGGPSTAVPLFSDLPVRGGALGAVEPLRGAALGAALQLRGYDRDEPARDLDAHGDAGVGAVVGAADGLRDEQWLVRVHPSRSDRGEPEVRRPEWTHRTNVQGGDYSPFIIPSFTTGGGGRSTIYYTLSTWNPYQVVIMSTTIKRGSS